MYFIANWKMFGGLSTLNSLKKVIKFLKIFKKSKHIQKAVSLKIWGVPRHFRKKKQDRFYIF